MKIIKQFNQWTVIELINGQHTIVGNYSTKHKARKLGKIRIEILKHGHLFH